MPELGEAGMRGYDAGMYWRLLLHSSASPALNMAVDEALLRELPNTELPILRIYSWNVPAVSLGYFQPTSLVPEWRPFVRRYTGGGLVDHAHDVTYSVVLPHHHAWLQLSAPESYCMIHRAVKKALIEAGFACELAPQTSSNESESCFLKPVKFDIVAGNTKLSGAAQRRTREGMLHQGSVLLPEPACRDTAKNRAVQEALPKAFASEFGIKFKSGELNAPELSRASKLEMERYATAEWNNSRTSS